MGSVQAAGTLPSREPESFDGFRSVSHGSETGPIGPNGEFVQRLAQSYTTSSSIHQSRESGVSVNRRSSTHFLSARLLRAVTFSLALFALAGLLGCGSSGGGGASTSASTAAAAPLVVDPIFLTPGETQAQLAWPASEGPVAHYLVFESRNGSGYTFSQLVPSPTAQVSGQAGDRIQVTVVGVSPNGEVSESSPPSPPLIFQAPASAAVAAAAPSAPQPTTLAATSTAPTEDSPEGMQTASVQETTNTSAASDESGPDSADTGETEPGVTLIARAVRALLLGGDARLPESGLSDEASLWLQGRVDQELAAGVALAGTGLGNDEDAVRELIWIDQAGQLFVSDGQEAVDSDDLPSTFAEALRLGATERFIGLADFDGDGRGDWLIEDSATGEVWMINGETEQNLPADRANVESRLAGLGDLDGDGRAELLWLSSDNRLELTRPGGDAPTLAGAAAGPEDFELLAIADLDGNGRDDLLGRDASGMLQMALSLDTEDITEDIGEQTAGQVRIEWRAGPASLTDGLDLVATVDVDDDGGAEIAWLNGDALEIWNVESGLEATLGL